MHRVVLVDDHLAIVAMMRAVVDDLDGFAVVGEAAGAAEAVAVCARHQPEVVVLDLGLGRDSGLAALPEIAQASPPSKVLVFSGHLRAAAIRRALALGAHGVIEKHAPLEVFHAALRAVAAGRLFFSPRADELLRRPSPAIRLSEREEQVLRAVAEGLNSKEIAARLGLTTHAVNNLRVRLTRRAGLRGTAQLVRYAVALGLVPDDLDETPDRR